jgi:hypothetical protein
MSVEIHYPRDLADKLHRQITSDPQGSPQLLKNQKSDPALSWMAAENERNFSLVRPVPSKEHTALILDVTYMASLLEEEGRRIQCDVGYISPNGARALPKSLSSVYEFDTPIPFSPSGLAKLSPAAQPKRTKIGVWPEDGQLTIWGLLHEMDRSYGVDLEQRPSYFTTSILRPGTFLCQFDERLQLFFSRDHGTFIQREYKLLEAVRDRAYIKPFVAEALCSLARRMLSHGHGGTILVVNRDKKPKGIVPHRHLWSGNQANPILYNALHAREFMSSGATIPEDLNAYVNDLKLRGKKAEDLCRQALDFVSHLTAVDGAVLLDEDLRILGAGTTVLTPDSAMPKEVYVEDPRAMLVFTPMNPSVLGGNRHRSAICFCAQQSVEDGLALALVASQDGDLSCFYLAQTEKIHALRPFELGVGM